MSQFGNDVILQSAMDGAVATLGSVFLFGEDFSKKTNVGGVSVSAPILVGAGVGIASGLQSTIDKYVTSRLLSGRDARTVQMVSAPLSAGIGSSVALFPFTQDYGSVGKVFLLGAGSQIVGSYGYKIVRPYLKR